MKRIAPKLLTMAALAILCASEMVEAQEGTAMSPHLPDYSEAGRKLPPGVPRAVDTNGNVTYIPLQFTSQPYREEASKLVLEEANMVARDLQLPGEFPIMQSNVLEFYVGSFGYNYAYRSVGSITTKDYIYYVSQGDRFSYLEGTHQLEDCRRFLREYCWPISRIDTNAAIRLASEWLTAAHMDVAGLNRDCSVTADVDKIYAKAPRGKFVPIYFVSWVPKHGTGGLASVRLCLPTKTLLQLRVEDPKYILRKPLVFTNLAELFPGVAPIHTNRPVKTIYMGSPPAE